MRRRALLAAGLLSPVAAGAQYATPSGVVPPGLQLSVLALWGDRVTADAVPFDPVGLTAAAAETQFGRDSHVVGLLPAPPATDGVPRATLVVAHRWNGVSAVSDAIQGASVLTLERRSQGWSIVDGGYQNRRLSPTSLTRTTAGAATPGLLGCSGGCITPWRTVLLCEGDSAFAGNPPRRSADAHGHILEFDPQDPTAIPIRRTSMGRLAAYHCTAAIARDGRAVVFLSVRAGLWRFVSEGDAQAPDALDRGRLWVRSGDDQTLRWEEVPVGSVGAGWATGLPLAMAPDGARLYLAANGAVFEFAFDQGDPAAPTARVSDLLRPSDPHPPEVKAQGAPPTAFPWLPGSLSALPGGNLLLGSGEHNPFAPGGFWRVATDAGRRGRIEPIWINPATGEGTRAGGGVLTPDRTTLILGFAPPERRDLSVTGTWPDFSATMPPRGGLVAVTRTDGRPFEG